MRPDSVLSPLGCALHDWNVGARTAPSAGARRRGLIVDLDDTLYPRETFVQSGLMAVARYVEETKAVAATEAFGVMTAARRQRGGQELQALCAHFQWADQDVAALLHVYRTHPPLLHLPRASANTLATLRGSGWRIAVLTNGLPSVQRAKVRALGLPPLVDAVIYAEEHATGGKPAAAAFRAALDALGLPARRCVCVGDDAVRDVGGAAAQGIRTVWVSADDSATASASGAPDACIRSIGELPAVLARFDMVETDAA
jgi:putative hydrolase of the HAD superfamily